MFGERAQSDLMGNFLNVTAVMSPYAGLDTIIELESDLKPKLSPLCFAYHLLQALEYTMNFSGILRVTPTYTNYKEETGEWSGMVGELVSGRADLSLTSITDIPLLHQAIDFNLPTWYWGFSAFYAIPNVRHEATSLLRPLTAAAWLGLALWMVTMAITVTFFDSASERISVALDNYNQSAASNSRLRFFVETLRHLPSSFMQSISFICHQDTQCSPTHTSIRIISWTGFLFGVVLHTMYSGLLLSYFSIVVDKFSDYEQLLDAGYKFNFVNSVLARQKIKYSTVQRLHEAYNNRDKSQNFTLIHELKSKILAGRFVYITADLAAYESFEEFTEAEKCAIGEVTLPIDKLQLGTMVPKNSPHKRIIDYQILRIKETGLSNLWFRRFRFKRPQCHHEVSVNEAVPIQCVLAALYLFSAFIALTPIILVLERHLRIPTS